MFECILERKKAFPDYKNNKLKKSKIWDFSKIVHDFGQKLAMFLSLYYRQNRPGKICLGIFYKEKKAFPHYKNSKLKKWKIWDFSKGVNPRFWLKIGNFSTLRFYHRRNRPRKCV